MSEISPAAPGVIRYWGSHFKSPRQVAHWRGLLGPLRARGWRVALVLERLPEDRSWTAALERDGVELVCLPRPRGQLDTACVRRTRALCAGFRAAVLHCENLHTSPMLGAWLARVPVRVWQKHSMFRHYEEGRAATWRERIAWSTRLTAALATRVIAVSSAVADELRQFGLRPEKIAVRNNPRTAAPDGHAPAGAGRVEARAALGWGEKEIVLVTLGQALPVKGWDVLLESFARVEKNHPDARLLFVGSHTAPGERVFQQRLAARVAALGLDAKVRFTGHVPDIAPVLRAADVFVMPSRSEGFSHALIEALEHGLPCVATRTGIAPEVIEEGRNGALVARGDEAALAQALGELCGAPARRAEFARHARVPSSIPTLAEYADGLAQDYATWLGAAQPEGVR